MLSIRSKKMNKGCSRVSYFPVMVLVLGIIFLCSSVIQASGSNSQKNSSRSQSFLQGNQKNHEGLPYIISMSVRFSSSHDADSTLSQFLSLMKEGMTRRLFQLDIKTEDIGNYIRAYALDEELNNSVVIINLKSSDFKLSKERDIESNARTNLKPFMIRNSNLILIEGTPTSKQIEEILSIVESEDKFEGIVNLKIAWQKIVEKSNLSFDDLVNQILDQEFGVTREEAQFPFLIEQLTGAEFAAQLFFYLKNIEFTFDVDEKNLNFLMKMEPIPASPFAKFIQQHQNRELSHLNFVPDNSDIIIFSSIDPKALVEIQKRSLEYDLSDVPWSKLEESYIRESWQLINDHAGDFFSMALYRHDTYGMTASIFLESLESQQVLWKWLSLIRLYMARELAMEEALIRSLGLESTYYANPYNLTEMIETSLELPYESVREEYPSLSGKQVFHLGFDSEDGTIASISSASIPEGVIAVASQNSLYPLAEFVQGLRYNSPKSQFKGPFRLDKEPWFGMLINLKGIYELYNEINQANPYNRSSIAYTWRDNEFISVVSWSEEDRLIGRLQLPLTLLNVINAYKK